jgi:hypothetical protein
MNTLKVEPYKLIFASDYHEFENIKKLLNDFFSSSENKSFHYEEVGMYDREYVAVFWYGEKTTDVEKYIKECKVEYSND